MRPIEQEIQRLWQELEAQRARIGKLNAGADGSGILSNVIRGDHMVAGAVATAKIADDAVDKTKIAADVAGSGIAQNADGSLELTPDNVTVKLTGDTLSAKDNYICIRDVKAANKEGGTFTAGAWQTRTLNEETSDTGEHATLASNQITLAAGTYRCHISAPAYGVDLHKIRLQNTTGGGTTLLIGTSERADDMYGTQTRSFLSGVFTIAASQALEVQHYCSKTYATSGFGIQSNFSVSEVYTIAEFWRIA